MESNQSTKNLFRFIKIILLFLVTVIILLAANLLASFEVDPYLSFFIRLQPSFYVDAFLALLLTSILYTPISYGITYANIQKHRLPSGIIDYFFLVRRPMLLVKAILLRLIVWSLRGLYQLIILLFGIMAETMICLIYLLVVGNDIAKMSMSNVPDFIVQICGYKSFRFLSIILWILILLMFAVTHLRFMMCKYALLSFIDLSVVEAIGVGRVAVRGRMFLLVKRLLHNCSYYIILIGSFGLIRNNIKAKSESFVSMAMRWVEQGRILYFAEKARKRLDK